MHFSRERIRFYLLQTSMIWTFGISFFYPSGTHYLRAWRSAWYQIFSKLLLSEGALGLRHTQFENRKHMVVPLVVRRNQLPIWSSSHYFRPRSYPSRHHIQSSAGMGPISFANTGRWQNQDQLPPAEIKAIEYKRFLHWLALFRTQPSSLKKLPAYLYSNRKILPILKLFGWEDLNPWKGPLVFSC